MPYKDIDGKFADKMRMVLYNMTKDLVDWKVIQRFFPDPIICYSHKKRCQLLLAFVDSTSNMGYKFNADDANQRLIAERYLLNFKFNKTYKYMKSYRYHFLLDAFDLMPNFDHLLEKTNNSFEDALTNINIANLNVISQMAKDLSAQTTDFENVDLSDLEGYVDEVECYSEDYSPSGIPEVDSSDRDKIEKMFTASILCQNLTELANKQHCNFMRCVSNLTGLIFDIQSMMCLTFEDGYKSVQVKIDEFEQKKIIKKYGKVVEKIINEIASMSGIECETTTKLNMDIMKTMKTHTIQLEDTKYDFALEFELTYEDPVIIEQICK